jgi:serine phosphatase RsbU (regulator of sigma subunit)
MMKNCHYRYLLWLAIASIYFLLPPKLSAQISYEGNPIYDLGTKVEYSYPSVNDGAWTDGEQDVLNFKMMRAPARVRVPIINNSNDEEILLVVDNAFLDSIMLTSLTTGEILYRTGDLSDFNTRPIAYRNFAFPIELQPGESDTLELRVNTKTSSFLPISLMNNRSFTEKARVDYLWFGLLYGAMVIMMLYNLFIYSVLRKNSYLWYVAFVMGNILLYASIEGHLKEYVLTGAGDWINRSVPFSIGLANVLLGQFTLSFIGRKRVSKRNGFIINGLSIIGAIIVVLSLLLAPAPINRAAQIFSLLTIAVMLGTGIIHLRRGDKSAIYFVVAFVIYLIGAISLIMRSLDIVPVNFYTNHLMEIGSLLEISLLSVALADRFRRMEIEKQQAQKNLLNMQKTQNEKLEQMVDERTKKLNDAYSEITTQNEELKQLTEEIGAQRDSLSERNEIIEKKQHDIDSSINYAKRIQQAILPDEQTLKRLFATYSILYRPKQVVSGDFYYATQTRDLKFIAVVDCTGHGVPGAIMSMIGHSALERAIHGRKLNDPGMILDEIHSIVTSSLQQNRSENRDGMDLSLCVINENTGELSFAGAKNPIYYRQDGNSYQVIKADKMSIGGARRVSDYHFKTTTLKVEPKGSIQIILCTDGFQDQFGGKLNKKIGRRTMLENFDNCEDLSKLGNELEDFLQKWKEEGREKQIDDICLFAFCYENNA